MEKRIKIAFVIKTIGLEYDDRLRKEILTLKEVCPVMDPYIYVMLPENKETEGVSSYGVPYKSVYITARDKYPSASKSVMKAWEFYAAIKTDLKKYDAIWAADVETIMVALFAKPKYLIWDLHELPAVFMGSSIKRIFLKRAFKRCDLIIHANPQRIDYLCETFPGLIERNKHTAIRNYPNFEDIDPEYDDDFKQFKEWKGSSKCVYLQGLNSSARTAYESISAILQHDGLKAVVLSKYDTESLERLEKEFGKDELSKRVFFRGLVPQMKIPQYMAQCDFSLIFYKFINPNNIYCEANRFYQAVTTGIPVVVGSNPSMKALVEEYGFGVSIQNDGSDTKMISDGIDTLLEGYDSYKHNCLKNREILQWNSQRPKFTAICDSIYDKL